MAAMLLAAPVALAEEANPLGMVISLMDSLSAKITAEGETEAKAYKDFVEWCDDFSRNKRFEIKTATSTKEKLEAEVAEQSANVEAASSKIDDLASSIAKDESELKDATTIRKKEAADFKANEGELLDIIDTLGRAVGILEREAAKNPAALAQIDSTNMNSLISSISAILDAASFAVADKQKLVALVQAQQGSGNDDDDLGAPAAAVYKTHSSNILDTLEDMKEKAEEQLSATRKAETNTRHNFDMLKQSLDDSIAADNKDMGEEKAAKSAATEAKATAEGDLSATKKDLADAEEALANGNRDCMQVASDHQATVAGRAEELKTIAEAKKILQGSSSGAESQTYSFLQVKTSSNIGAQITAAVKQLARKEHSAALAQLASQIGAVMRLGGDDPFGKVRNLISEMITKLTEEADAEADEKAYCDEQMAKTEEKKVDLESDISKLSAKIDQASSKSAALKTDVKELQAELAALAKSQVQMDQIRQESHADFVQAQQELQEGLAGVRSALQTLRSYYGSSSAFLQSDLSAMQQPPKPELFAKAGGAGSSIIGILEVVESDFAKNLAQRTTEEDDEEADYQSTTQENKVTKTLKDQDVKYKTQEFTGLDKNLAAMSSDRDTANNELSAVMDYYGKIKERCIAKPETYEERKRRRESEIEGLKSALNILEDETALVQRKKRGLRGGVIQ